MQTINDRYVVRGYFSGDGQHWIRVWDTITRAYLPGFHRTWDAAIAEAQSA